MKSFSIFKFQLLSIVIEIILGVILHFTFNVFNQNLIVGAISAVNESTWEHLKLAFFPMLLTTILGLFIYNKNYPNFLCNKTKGIILAISFITIFFYTYTGIIGKNVDILNILSFIFAIIFSELYVYFEIIKNKNCRNKIAILILIVLLLSFIKFTYSPPHINLFKDPISNMYGI